MAKSMRPKKKLTESQLKNLNGVKNAKPKTKETIPNKEKTRRDWEHNNELIHTIYTELLLKKGKPPLITEISKQTGLNWNTVFRHLENFDFEQIKMQFRMGNQAVYMNLYKNAATSKNPKWSELYLKWNGDIQQKVDITSGGKPLPQPPPPLQGVVSIDPKTLPTDVLEKIIAANEKTDNG